MCSAAYVFGPYLSVPSTQVVLLTAPPDVTICSIPRPDGLLVSPASIHLVDLLHVRTGQSPTKKGPLPRLNINTSFINTPLFPQSM